MEFQVNDRVKHKLWGESGIVIDIDPYFSGQVIVKWDNTPCRWEDASDLEKV